MSFEKQALAALKGFQVPDPSQTTIKDRKPSTGYGNSPSHNLQNRKLNKIDLVNRRYSNPNDVQKEQSTLEQSLMIAQ
jgi:hypothetical protein